MRAGSRERLLLLKRCGELIFKFFPNEFEKLDCELKFSKKIIVAVVILFVFV